MDSTQEKSQKLLQESLDIKIKFISHILKNDYNADTIKDISKETKVQFYNLLPKVPDIGDYSKNHFAKYMPFSALILSFYIVMKKKIEPKEIGRILFNSLLLETRTIPEWYFKMTERNNWREWRDTIKNWSKVSLQKKYKMDYAYKFLSKKGDLYDFGFDMYESGMIKYFNSYKASDIIPYLGVQDYVVCDVIGIGLSRTKTLNEGDELSDYRFKIGGKSNITLKEEKRLIEMGCEYY